MVKDIYGPSPVTEYQLKRYSENNLVDQDEVLNLYIKYALVFNIQVDVAYIMCLTYTDFFTKEIIGNNIAGIGIQAGGNEMEDFGSIEDCIIAHYELLQKISSDDVITDKPHSTAYYRLDSDFCKSSKDAYTVFAYNESTNYNIHDFSRFLKELNKTRKENPGYTDSTDMYYYVKLISSSSKREMIKKRSDLINKKFDPKTMYILDNKNGTYSLEIGRYTNPVNANILLRNLQMFGYNGTVEFRLLR